MRNRGYRFIVRDLGFTNGSVAMCVNSTWINELLRANGIDPVIFRKLTWEDLVAAAGSERQRRVIADLRPRNFWQMCDTVSLMYTRYDSVDGTDAYMEPWFKHYPILVAEDIYEFMLDEGYSQEEAVELMEYCKDHIGDSDRSDLRDMLELYDVPDEISSVILDIRRLPSRERMIAELIKLLSRAAVELEHRPELKETKDIY